jgi:hypothetical protein
MMIKIPDRVQIRANPAHVPVFCIAFLPAGFDMPRPLHNYWIPIAV